MEVCEGSEFSFPLALALSLSEVSFESKIHFFNYTLGRINHSAEHHPVGKTREDGEEESRLPLAGGAHGAYRRKVVRKSSESRPEVVGKSSGSRRRIVFRSSRSRQRVVISGPLNYSNLLILFVFDFKRWR